MPNISTLIIIFGVLLISSSAIGGTILLMGIGLGTPGMPGPPPDCTNSLNFAQACNSQYIPVAL